MLTRIYDGGTDAVEVHDPTGRRRVSDDNTAVGPVYHAIKGEPVQLPEDIVACLDASGEWLDENGASTAPQIDAAPLPGYDGLNAGDALNALKAAVDDLELFEAIKAYEAAHKKRSTVLDFSPPDPTDTTPLTGEKE